MKRAKKRSEKKPAKKKVAKRKPARKKATKKKILVVADLVDSTKNISGILNAFKSFKIEHQDWSLDIIGDGPDAEKLFAYANENKIKDVNFLGRLPNDKVLRLYEAYDFLISFSNFETFGLTLAEALAAGIPVIATKCGGPETFINENNGILINPKDVQALTAAMGNMANKKDHYSIEYLQQSVAQFQASAVQSAFRKMYQGLLDIK